MHRKDIIILAISLSVFEGVLFSSTQLVNLWESQSINRQLSRVEGGIQAELQSASLQREQILASEVFTGPLKRGNPVEILAVAQAEAKKRALDFIVVTDKNGFVLARAHLPLQTGDNFFLTSAYGRIIAKGEASSVTVIERGPRVPLIFVSVSQVLDGGAQIGGITIGYSLYDSYAYRFQEKYLSYGAQILFYTPQEGIVGDSLNDKTKTKLLNTYFSLGSDNGAQNIAGISKEINIGDEYYIARDVVFPGIEKSPGGALILFPVQHRWISFFFAIGTVLAFSVFYLLFSLSRLLNHHKHSALFFWLVGAALFSAAYFAYLLKLNNSSLVLEKSPYIIYNSVIKFNPESDVIRQSSEKLIAIEVITGGEDINVVSAVVHYDPTVVEVLDIVTMNSFCAPSFFLEKEINKEKGEVRITCGIPNPGFYAAVGTVAELLIQPLSIGSISLEFTDETQVLANDGLGTDVLRLVTNGYYQVVRQEFAISDITNQIPVFSPSHPNSNRWYGDATVKLSWPGLSGGTYYYSLDNHSEWPTEDKVVSTKNNHVDALVDNGIWYFHLQAKDETGTLGPRSSFKIMVDSIPPLPPSIKVSGDRIKRGDVVRLEFTSEDALSGLQAGFYIKINNSVFLPVKPPFYIPFLDSGEYSVIVRVFDGANNFSDSNIVINVSD